MNKSRLRGAVLFALVFTGFMFIVSGDDRSGANNLLVLLGVAVISLPVGYYLWPTFTFIGDLYRDRGYTIRPSWSRLLSTIAFAVMGALMSLLFDRLGGGEGVWTDMLRTALITGAFAYFVYLPPRTAAAADREPGPPRGTLPTAR